LRVERLLSFASTEDGEGGRTTTAGGGVGGYEWMVTELEPSMWVLSVSSEGDLADDEGAPGIEEILVRHENERAASTWYGESRGRGNIGMNIPGGKEGERRRMYQPRLGRCIVQHMVDDGLCTTCSTISSSKRNLSLYQIIWSEFSSEILTLMSEITSEPCTTYRDKSGAGGVAVVF